MKQQLEAAIEGKHSKLTEVYKVLESECQVELAACRGGNTTGSGVDGDGTDQRMDALDDEMRSLIAPHYARGVAGLTELPSVGPRDPEAWERLLAATALSCSGLTVFLKDAIDAWFLRAYDELLRALLREGALPLSRTRTRTRTRTPSAYP